MLWIRQSDTKLLNLLASSALLPSFYFVSVQLCQTQGKQNNLIITLDLSYKFAYSALDPFVWIILLKCISGIITSGYILRYLEVFIDNQGWVPEFWHCFVLTADSHLRQLFCAIRKCQVRPGQVNSPQFNLQQMLF